MKATQLIKHIQSEVEEKGDQEILIKLKSMETGEVIYIDDFNELVNLVSSGGKDYIRIKAYVKNFKGVK